MAVVFRNIVSNQLEEGSSRSIHDQPLKERSQGYRKRRRRRRRKIPNHRKLYDFPASTTSNGVSFSKKLGPYLNLENDFNDINEIPDSLVNQDKLTEKDKDTVLVSEKPISTTDNQSAFWKALAIVFAILWSATILLWLLYKNCVSWKTILL